MAGTIHQQGIGPARELEEEDWKKLKLSIYPGNRKDLRKRWDDRNSTTNPRNPEFEQRLEWKPSRLGSRDTASWVTEELRNGGNPSHGAALSGDHRQSESQIDAATAALRACTRNKDLIRGTSIHEDLVQKGLLQKCAHALVIMYAKCGELGKAREMLDAHKSSSDVVSWTALIAGYAREGHGQTALDCFIQMQREGIVPNAVTYACVLKACATIGAGAAGKGKQIHDEIVRQGMLQNDVVLGSALVDMYAKCGAVSRARQVHNGLPARNAASWNALIAAYAQEGDTEQALDCFEKMWRDGIVPNAVTYVCVLKACGTIDKGKQIHDEIIKEGLLRDNIVLGGALVDMYAKCGAVVKAKQVLDGLPSRNVVAWSAVIAGYAQAGDAEQALNCFEEMKSEGIVSNSVTYLCVLKACAMVGAGDKGKQIHDEIARQGLLQNNIELGNALVDMYAKCGAVSKARQVLDGLPSRNVVSWSAMIAGYAQQGDTEQALDCLEEMQREGIFPNAVTYVCLLKACATVGAAEKGKRIHDEIAEQGLLQSNIVLGNAVVDMYAKCGAVSKARQVLDGLPCRDVVTWSALIAGYTQEGDAEQALNCLEEMQREGILPNVITCASVLNVCSHRGLVEEGQELFLNMSAKYDVNPDLACYTCMVDLLGRAGHLDKALKLIQDMPSSDYLVMWRSLLGACRKWADVNVGRLAFERAVKLDRSDGPAYLLMGHIFGNSWHGTQGRIRQSHEDQEESVEEARAWSMDRSTRSYEIETCSSSI